MLMARVVSDLASRTPGKEAVAMESFAKALRMVRFYKILYMKLHVFIWEVNSNQADVINKVLFVP